MSVILQRLESLGMALTNASTANDDLDQTIMQQLSQLSSQRRLELVLQHAQLNVEYSVLCSKISLEWDKKKQRDDAIIAALKTAQLLEIIYRDYLDCPREVRRLQNELRLFRQYINDPQPPSPSNTPPTAYSKTIREGTSNLNFYRLLSARIRRLALAIAPLFHEQSFYQQAIHSVDIVARPFFNHLAWLYFIPRLTNNLAMVLKHTIAHRNMSPAEQALGWQNRLRIQLEHRWPEISNDLPWFLANLASCFLLTGSFLPYAAILTICMQFYEVAQATLQAFIDIRRLHGERKRYEALLLQPGQTTEQECEIKEYLVHLNKRITYESKRLFIPVGNTTILLLAIILASPLFAFNPIFAVIGGGIAVLTTLIAVKTRTTLDKTKPTVELFFKRLSEPAKQNEPPAANPSPVTV